MQADFKSQLREWWGRVDRRERAVLGGVMLLSAAIVLIYTLLTRPNDLGGDQATYHQMGIFFTEGRWWWSDAPYGIPHASAWKAPLYPAWVGFWYELLGVAPARLAFAQGILIAPLTVFLTWLLGRRLFGRHVAIAAALVIAVFPLSWEWIGLLYPEVLAIPVVLVAMILFLERDPTPPLAIATGAAIGVGMLIRPNLFFLFAGVLVAWWIRAGAGRALRMSAVSIGVAALLIMPWTIRNLSAADGFVPISVQDAAVYGTFNEDAASDPRRPYQWRAFIDPMPEVFNRPGTADAELRRELIGEAWDYIGDNPSSVPKAFFWNGITRFWDLRRPANAESEIVPTGRVGATGIAGLVIWWLLLPLALFTLWRLRERPQLLWPLLATALVASITVIPDASTRYRAPLLPIFVILAMAAILARDGRRPPSHEPGSAGDSSRASPRLP